MVRSIFRSTLRCKVAPVTVGALSAALLLAGLPAGRPAGAATSAPAVPAPSAPPAAPGSPGIGDPGGPLPPDAAGDRPTPPPVQMPRQPSQRSPNAAPAPPPLPPTPTGLPAAIEPLSPYLGQVSCDLREKPGVRAFADLLLRTYPDTASAGIVRRCLVGGTSEHKEGRAFDWWVSAANPAQWAEVAAVFRWLFATDAAGNEYAMARRLGIMYIIWNDQVWSAYRAADGWREYACYGTTGCHRDHVHFSFGWAGAWQRTSFWSKTVAPVDYGPCVPPGQRNAPVYSRYNARSCPSVPTPPTPRTDLQFMQQNLNLVVGYGDGGSAVAVVQRQVGATADGSYGSRTQAAVSAYQRANGLPVTGWVGQATWRAFVVATLRALARRVGDFNGDGRADRAVFRPSNGGWYVRGVLTAAWGARGDAPVPADYNGDGRVDLAVFKRATGNWWVRGMPTVQYGLGSDVPVPADYNGDGRADIAVFRPSTGVWYVRGVTVRAWGQAGDVPVPADYNGNYAADVAVFRPSTGTWWVRGMAAVRFGGRGDVPAPGDYNGDVRADLAVFRPSSGVWYVRGVTKRAWGARGDVPSPADYNGDHRADLTVYRPASGNWWMRGGGITRWGVPGDAPLVLPYAIARSVISFG